MKEFCDQCGREITRYGLKSSTVLNFDLKDENGTRQFGIICSWACVAVLAYIKSHEQLKKASGD